MPVVDTHVARQAGIVSDVLLDLHAGRVAVLNVIADGWLVQRIPAEYVYRLGPHTVLVADTVAVDLGPPAAEQPWFPIKAVVGLEVLTEGGDRVGQIVDADLDDQTLAVKAYLLRNAVAPGAAVGASIRRGRHVQPRADVDQGAAVVAAPTMALADWRSKAMTVRTVLSCSRRSVAASGVLSAWRVLDDSSTMAESKRARRPRE